MPNADSTLLTACLRRLVVRGTEEAALTDGELVGRFVDVRDPTAFEVLVWRHGPMVWATCQRLLGHSQDVEDAFQATFLALARSARSVGRRGTVAAWLHRVATNAALKLRAKRLVTGLPAEELIQPASDPDAGEFVGAVDEELERLPEQVRAAFVLCCLEGMTSAEAARELSCPVGTVDSRLHAARVRLRERLIRRGFGPAALAGLAAVALPSPSAVMGAVRAGSGVCPSSAVSLLANQVRGTMMRVTLFSRSLVAVVVAMAVLVAAWSLLGPGEGLQGAPVPQPSPPREGRIALWRQGFPVAIHPHTKEVAPLPKGFEGKRGNVWLNPDGRSLLVYVANRITTRPDKPENHDQVYLEPLENREAVAKAKPIEVEGVSLCHAFWGADGRVVYGFGIAIPAGDGPLPNPDMTTDMINWSFDTRTGKAERLNLPGDVTVLDRSPDGKTFLAMRYEKAQGTEYAFGLLTADGRTFTSLTKEKEQTPADFRFSPDGKRAALGRVYKTVNGDLGSELVVFDLKTRERTVVATPKDANVSGACWSPDGKQIAYVWEPRAAEGERNKERDGPFSGVVRYDLTVTIARPDGTEAQKVYGENESWFGSIDWR